MARALAAAAREAVVRAATAADVKCDHFEAANAASLFERVHAEMEQGPGFIVVSGLPVNELTYPQHVALTLGMCDHVGKVVPQNFELQRIVDVRDEGIEYSCRSRGYRGNKQLPFHTDGAHLFGLVCLGTADTGGETIIVSASAVYNELACDHTNALEILQRGFYHHRRGKHEPDESTLTHARMTLFSLNSFKNKKKFPINTLQNLSN